MRSHRHDPVVLDQHRPALHWGQLQDDGVPEISTGTSLVVIGIVLTITTIASLVKVRRDPSARAPCGLPARPPARRR